jgi:fimbrial chaperone protein
MVRFQRMAAVIAAAILISSRALAASVDINPVRIDLAGQGQPTELRLTNIGSAEISVQVDTLKWDQDLNGSDQLVATDELLAVPPIFTVPAGEQQIVRIGYLGQASPDFEQSYRLLITELAPPPSSDGGGSKLSMRMRFSIPAFVAPSVYPARPEIVLLDVSTVEDSLILTVENAGTAHARLGRLEVRGDTGWESLPESLTIRYLLPGAIATIAIPPEFGLPSAVRISSIDGRDWEYAVHSPY